MDMCKFTCIVTTPHGLRCIHLEAADEATARQMVFDACSRTGGVGGMLLFAGYLQTVDSAQCTMLSATLEWSFSPRQA